MRTTCLKAALVLSLLLVLPMHLNAQEPDSLTKQPGTASVSQSSLIYGLEAVSPQITSETNDSLPEITYKIQGASDDSFTPEVPTQAGVYTVRVRYPETDTHLEAVAETDFTIRAYVTEVVLSPFEKPPARPYDGTTQADLPLPFSFTVEGTSQNPQPGQDYAVTASLTSPKVNGNPEDKNVTVTLQFLEGLYAPAPDLQQEFTFHMDILKAPLTIRALDQVGIQTLSADPQQVTAEGLAEGDTLSEVTLTPNEPGTALLPENPRILRGTEDVTDQYDIRLAPGQRILEASVTDFPTAAENLIYTGQLQSLLTFPGKAENGSLVYELRYRRNQSTEEQLLSNWSESMPMGKDPGIYTVCFKAQNPALADSEVRSVIAILSPRPLSVTARGEKLYDGRPELPDGNVSFSLDETGILPGNQVRIKAISDSRFQQVAAGENLKIIPGNVVLEGKDAEFYSVKIASFEGFIHKKPLTVTAKSASKIYGQPDPAISYAAEGLIFGEVLSGKPGRTPGQNCGTYEITQGSLTEENNPNYAIAFETSDFEILPAKASLTLTPSRHKIRPGKTVTLRITAENAEETLTNGAWTQPDSVVLKQGDTPLSAEKIGPGLWEASFTVPKGAKGTFRFTAELRDPNYLPARAETSVSVSYFGSNPMTGDLILLSLGLLILSASLLGFLILKHKKHR